MFRYLLLYERGPIIELLVETGRHMFLRKTLYPQSIQKPLSDFIKCGWYLLKDLCRKRSLIQSSLDIRQQRDA